MQEIGPIRYRNVVSRTNVNFTADQSVIYQNSLAFILDENSPVSENTTIVTLNVPYVIIMKQLDVLPKFVRGLIVSLMKDHLTTSQKISLMLYVCAMHLSFVALFFYYKGMK